LVDRSSAPRRVANRTAPERIDVIVRLRRLRMTAAEISEALVMPLSTVSGILTRLGLGRLGRLGLEQPVRYERSRPGELVHVDVKKLGRIEGGAGKRAFGDSRRYATRSYTDRDGHRRAQRAGSTSTSRSTTTAASPTPRSSLTRKRQPPPASCNARSPSTDATASASSVYSPTTAPVTAALCTRSPVGDSASATSVHAHTDRKRTAKRNASSAHC
jgi:hypothetical protein